ncbi:MAG: LpxL/LpxP family Kdo(2)-lipid IV(A) lauroyl/palmitoleoyl acyltransferase [Gammaproteobacteria bacterium]|nr:LpxL/LpxP family Kdo(2)-lipid IV(A) lauroyl/palmitoleoyl acyltransferase [Gammaproteobacteria bacterium]
MTTSAENTLSMKMRDLPVKMGILLIHFVGKLPYPVLVALGKGVGLLMLKLAKSRRKIAEANLRLCFPEYSDVQQKELLRDNFKSTGIGLMETAFCWSANPKRLLSNSELKGQQHLLSVLESGKGAIILGFHLTSLEFGGIALANTIPMAAMYRKNRNKHFEKAMCEGRLRNVTDVIERDDVRTMIKSLKAGKAVWYAADQDYGAKHSIFVPFFDIPAATITATSRFVRLTKVPVIPMTHYRDPDTKKFIIQLHPALENFTSIDEYTDAKQINQFLEQFLIQHPADYLWLHRRFKTRPEGLSSLYKAKSIYRIRTMLDSGYNKLLRDSSLLEGSEQKPLLIELPDGSYMKFLYPSHFLLRSLAKKVARKWQKEKNNKIIYMYRYPPLGAEIIHFKKIQTED